MEIQFSYWALQTVAMVVTCYLIPKLKITSPIGPLGMVVALGFINTHYWDAALFFQLPESVTTNTLLLVGANGVIFWLLVKFLPGIETEGVLPSLIAPVVFTGCSIVINKYGRTIDWPKVWEAVLPVLLQIREMFFAMKPALVPGS